MAVRPQSFTAFCASIGVTLEPGQRVLCQVAFDGMDPVDLPDDLRALAREMFGPSVERIPPAMREVIVWVIGARGGKSYIGALRMLHLACTVTLRLAPGERASANIIAPDLDLARQTLSYVKGAVRANASLARMAVKCTDESDEVILRRDGGDVTIKCRAAGAKGRTGRGRSLVGYFMDEAAIFRDANDKINDIDVYNANQPRVMEGGQGLIASTPWAEMGLLYEMHNANFDGPRTALAAQAPTRLVRSDAKILREVDREYARDADNAAREFGAQFMSAGTELLYSGAALNAAVDWQMGEVTLPQPGAVVTAGGDLGFVHDASALVARHLYSSGSILAEVGEKRPASGCPLVPSEVVAWLVGRCQAHGALGLMADAHYRETLREATTRARLTLYDAPTRVYEPYLRMKALLNEGSIKWAPNEHFMSMMRAVRKRALPGGGLSILLPRIGGGHCDPVSAAVLAVAEDWGAVVPKPRPPANTEAAMLAEERARLDDEVRRRRNDRAENEAFYDDS